MLTPSQEKWIAHLQDDNATEIIPFDEDSGRKFEIIKKEIQDKLGKEVEVVHRGATSLGISGQGELDICILVLPEIFDKYLALTEKIYGAPRSMYPMERARFVTVVENKKAEIFVINEMSQNWKDGETFEKYLREHTDALEEYRKIKEEGRELSTREYYRRKIEFINEILTKTKDKNLI